MMITRGGVAAGQTHGVSQLSNDVTKNNTSLVYDWIEQLIHSYHNYKYEQIIETSGS